MKPVINLRIQIEDYRSLNRKGKPVPNFGNVPD
jgi:hypothetical protein